MDEEARGVGTEVCPSKYKVSHKQKECFGLMVQPETTVNNTIVYFKTTKKVHFKSLPKNYRLSR